MSQREVHLTSRPTGRLAEKHLHIVETAIPTPGDGQLLVRNRLMAVSAVMRSLMGEMADPPVPLYEPGQVLTGPAIGEVITAPGTRLNPGDLVSHGHGWREYAVVDVADAELVDPDVLPELGAHLSQGVTAWLGVVRGAEVRDGDTVFVTSAAGGVGSLAGQFARLRGASRVIGSTSSRSKADYLLEKLGYDAVVIRGEGSIEDQLRTAAPDGIDAVFDNVGGEQLRAALALARRGARVALVGALSAQVTGTFSAPAEIDTGSLILRGITLRGMPGSDHLDAIPQALREFGDGLRDGRLTFPHARLQGIDQAPRALRELLTGDHIGAVLVEL